MCKKKPLTFAFTLPVFSLHSLLMFTFSGHAGVCIPVLECFITSVLCFPNVSGENSLLSFTSLVSACSFCVCQLIMKATPVLPLPMA